MAVDGFAEGFPAAILGEPVLTLGFCVVGLIEGLAVGFFVGAADSTPLINSKQTTSRKKNTLFIVVSFSDGLG